MQSTDTGIESTQCSDTSIGTSNLQSSIPQGNATVSSEVINKISTSEIASSPIDISNTTNTEKSSVSKAQNKVENSKTNNSISSDSIATMPISMCEVESKISIEALLEKSLEIAKRESQSNVKNTKENVPIPPQIPSINIKYPMPTSPIEKDIEANTIESSDTSIESLQCSNKSTVKDTQETVSIEKENNEISIENLLAKSLKISQSNKESNEKSMQEIVPIEKENVKENNEK